jgi:hypothetical protein
VPTLVLSPRYTPDSNALWKAAIQAGWSVERLHSRQPPPDLRDREPILYGEGLFVSAMADALDLAMLEPTFCWLADLPEPYRQRGIRCTTLQNARQEPRPAFIKPAIDKSFDAKVYDSSEALPPVDIFSEDMPVLISEPVEWEIEFRCFVRERSLVTQSPYLRRGSLLEDTDWHAEETEIAEAIHFCETLLNDSQVKLPPAVVIDVGHLSNEKWAVVEANPAWASGIYGCNPAAVLGVIQRACIPHDRLKDEDKQWLVDRTNMG